MCTSPVVGVLAVDNGEPRPSGAARTGGVVRGALAMAVIVLTVMGCTRIEARRARTDIDRERAAVDRERSALLRQYRECLLRSETDAAVNCSGYETMIESIGK